MIIRKQLIKVLLIDLDKCTIIAICEVGNKFSYNRRRLTIIIINQVCKTIPVNIGKKIPCTMGQVATIRTDKIALSFAEINLFFTAAVVIIDVIVSITVKITKR